jgi:hypothetical protein
VIKEDEEDSKMRRTLGHAFKKDCNPVKRLNWLKKISSVDFGHIKLFKV